MLIAPEEPECETLRVPVLQVFDGDGFLTRIGAPRRNSELEVSVRFGFIDAPEMDQPGGREARDFLCSLISGQWLDLVILTKMDTGGIVDRYGRVVAVPYLRQQRADNGIQPASILRALFGSLTGNTSMSRNIELEMVLNGWAWVLDRYEPDERYFCALDDAQRNRRGIWAWGDNIHPWEFKRQRYRTRRQKSCNAMSQPNLSLSEGPDIRCPNEGCAGRLVRRSGRFGTFYGCSNFPECRYSCANPLLR